MILINDITFSYNKAYSDGEVVDVVHDGVSVEYVVIQQRNEIKGRLMINFNEYKQMNYDDLINAIKDEFNKMVESVD